MGKRREREGIIRFAALISVISLIAVPAASAAPEHHKPLLAKEPKAKSRANFCPDHRRALAHYRIKHSHWLALRGVGEKLTVDELRQPHGCAYTRYLALKWKQRAARAEQAYDRYVRKQAARRAFRALYEKWRCIHEHEGAWDANTGNGYYGGLQMDEGFQKTYGWEFWKRWGTANNWPVWAQLQAAERAYWGYRGYGARYFGPWPNTSRMCGLR